MLARAEHLVRGRPLESDEVEAGAAVVQEHLDRQHRNDAVDLRDPLRVPLRHDDVCGQ